MKIYPAVLLLLFINEKRFRPILICLAFTVGISLVSLLCFKGGFLPNLEFLLHGLNISSNPDFVAYTSIKSDVVQRGVSLLTFIKIIYLRTGLLPGIIKNHFLPFYEGFAFILALLVFLYVVFVEKETWKRVALLVFSMLLLPTLSADYKLLHIFLPLLIFINTEHRSRLDILYLIIFALLLIPKDYYYLADVQSETDGIHDISIAVMINVLLMVVMSILIMINGIKRFFLDRHGPSQVIEVVSGKGM